MPTSLESLKKHRAAHASEHPWRIAWRYHSHAIFDHTAPERVEDARRFRDLVARTFEGNPHVEVNSFMPAPAGPFKRGNFEVLFTREAFAEHGARAIWLGTPGHVDLAFLAAVDEKIVAANRDEEAVIDGTKKH